jgi:hypothetical protein
VKSTLLGSDTGYFREKSGSEAKKVSFLAKKSHFLGGNSEKNAKNGAKH